MLKKRQRPAIAPVSFVADDETVAGMRSDYKQRKVDIKERIMRDKVNQSVISSRGQLFRKPEQAQSL